MAGLQTINSLFQKLQRNKDKMVNMWGRVWASQPKNGILSVFFGHALVHTSSGADNQ